MAVRTAVRKRISLRPLLECFSSSDIPALVLFYKYLVATYDSHSCCNWAITFHGIAHEDWRYAHYRRTQHPAIFHLINFFGLNMVPTLVVFVSMLPALMLYETAQTANVLTWLGFVVCLASATIQLIADKQIHDFRASNPGQYCNVGLWKHGRHPNYFGEIQFWWGIWIIYASLNGFNWFICCPIAMTALFLGISVPLMEKRQLQNKPGYAEYRKQTRMLI